MPAYLHGAQWVTPFLPAQSVQLIVGRDLEQTPRRVLARTGLRCDSHKTLPLNVFGLGLQLRTTFVKQEMQQVPHASVVFVSPAAWLCSAGPCSGRPCSW